MNNQYIVCGISTGCGKSVVSSVLYDLLKRQTSSDPLIIKPIQTGNQLDTIFYQKCGIDKKAIVNFYTMRGETSIHQACKEEGLTINVAQLLQDIRERLSEKRPTLIELAGGLLSPINETDTMLDLVKPLQLPVILVVDTYLGAINHALLTIEGLTTQGVPIHGLVMNTTNAVGGYTQEALGILSTRTKLPLIGTLPFIEAADRGEISSPQMKHLSEGWRLDG